MAIGVANGHNFLYVTNFHSGRVETYDETFHQVNPNGFADPAFHMATRHSASTRSMARFL